MLIRLVNLNLSQKSGRTLRSKASLLTTTLTINLQFLKMISTKVKIPKMYQIVCGGGAGGTLYSTGSIYNSSSYNEPLRLKL